MPLVILWFPEVLAAERLFTLGRSADFLSIVGFSLMLACGSFLLASAVDALEQRLRRWISTRPAS
jgi:hypothetical protein